MIGNEQSEMHPHEMETNKINLVGSTKRNHQEAKNEMRR